MRFRNLLVLFFMMVNATTYASDRTYTAQRLRGTVKIDGRLSDVAWNTADIAGNFLQNEPVQNAPVTQQTEVRLLFDDQAIYIGAMMYDSAPDSILHQLGDRDDIFQLNADGFRLGLDPYNKRLDGYVFIISASGIQAESYNMDFSFDAVWESAVQISDSGWSAELCIPYSQLRFPDIPEQTWGIQFARVIRRNREYDQWSPVRKEIQNPLLDWGTMTGIRDIDPPIRLSLTPYLSFYDENAPVMNGNELDHYENSYSYSGGADLKLGLNESFTVDMTLLPDFSQVQSDNKIKNLTAFEQIFKENRPFFKEGTSLFETGKLFYSRRIGKTPTLFYAVPDSLRPGEEIERNPTTAHLVNATKISGRTSNGLGIGILNAVTGNTYATLLDEAGNRRKVLTDPLSNYSVLVIDQQLKNNDDLWLVNTSTLREGTWRDADVWSGGIRLEDKLHIVRFTGRYANSNVWEWQDINGTNKREKKSGNQLSLNLEKISGKFQLGSVFEFGEKNFDKNDLGYIFINDYSEANVYGSYNLFNPFWKNRFRQGTINFWIDRMGKWSLDNQLVSLSAGGSVFLLDRNNASYFINYYSNLEQPLDWFEPRVDGRFFLAPKMSGCSGDFSTNYNNPVSFDYGLNLNWSANVAQRRNGCYVKPMIRFNDHLSASWTAELAKSTDELGFCTFDSLSMPVFGKRDVLSVTNTLTARYQFSRNLSLSFRGRHYWSKGDYAEYFQLEEDGSLSGYPPLANGQLPFNTDFNTNYFNLDVVFSWVFAPGSSLLLTCKSQISTETNDTSLGYLDNLRGVYGSPQNDSVTLKVLYFLDYERVTHRRKPIG